MRTRLIEALDPARLAKEVLCLLASEPVGGEVGLAFEQREPVVRDEQVEKAGGRTDRAIAIEQFGFGIGQRLEPDRAAMAASCDRNQLPAHSTVTDFARLRG